MRATASLTKECYGSFPRDILTAKSRSTEGRWLASRTKHSFKKSTKSVDHWEEESVGGLPAHTSFMIVNGFFPS